MDQQNPEKKPSQQWIDIWAFLLMVLLFCGFGRTESPMSDEKLKLAEVQKLIDNFEKVM